MGICIYIKLYLVSDINDYLEKVNSKYEVNLNEEELISIIEYEELIMCGHFETITFADRRYYASYNVDTMEPDEVEIKVDLDAESIREICDNAPTGEVIYLPL